MRLIEFFEGEDGRLSMTRLVVFCTVPFSSAVVLKDSDQLANYLGAYVISYGIGKVAGMFQKGGTDGEDSRAPESIQVVSPGGTSVDVNSSHVGSAGVARKGKPVRRGKTRAF